MRTRKQEFCRNCDEATLHIREVVRPAHLLHFFITLSTCGWWLLVWVAVSTFPRKYPWMCSICGQAVTDLTHEEERTLAYGRHVHAERRNRAVGNAATTLGRGIVDFFQGILSHLDSILLRLAGGDGFMYWFFFSIFLGTGTAVAAIAMLVWFRVF